MTPSESAGGAQAETVARDLDHGYEVGLVVLATPDASTSHAQSAGQLSGSPPQGAIWARNQDVGLAPAARSERVIIWLYARQTGIGWLWYEPIGDSEVAFVRLTTQPPATMRRRR